MRALDIIPEKVDMLNRRQSPIADAEIEAFLAADASGERPLSFTATIDPQEA